MATKVTEFLRERGGQLLTVLSAIALASFAPLENYWNWAVFLLGVTSAVASIVVESRKQNVLKSLSSDLNAALAQKVKLTTALAQRAEYAELIAHTLIVDIAQLCEVDPNTVRASVYERRSGEWVRLTRYSASAAYREGGRERIPMGTGLLQRALERAHAEAVGLPDRDKAPAQYEREQVRLGLQPGVSASLGMASRSYAVFRIEGPPTEISVRTFMLCLESTDPQGVIGSSLDELLKPWWWTLHRAFCNAVAG